MALTRVAIGDRVRCLGWAMVVIFSSTTAFHFFSIYSDISVRVYAMLVFLEEGSLVILGLIVVFIGRLIRGRPPLELAK